MTAFADVPMHPTTQRQLEETVPRLREAAPGLARLPLGERIALARSMQAGYLRIAEASVQAGCRAKGIPLGTPAEGEEWVTGPWSVVRHLRLVAASLTALQQTGNTPIGPVHYTEDGQLSVRVFPANAVDGVLFAKVTTEVRCRPGVREDEMQASRASFYKGQTHNGRTVLVLGGGNIAAIPAMDVITKMFNEGKVCILKMHAVNAYLGPLLETAFADAIRRNYLAIVYGGADEGAYLAQHAGVDEIHLTGSAQTYEQIVWGPPGPARDARKARNAPLIAKPFTAELGNVSPVIVVPGPYSDRELAFQAEGIAGAAMYNAGFICTTPRVLVTPKGWSPRMELLAGIERGLARAPVRQAYYPGAEDRWHELTCGRAQMRTIGAAGVGQLPWTLVTGLDATDLAERAFSVESFCSLLSETEVGSDDPVEFLDRAVAFANHRLAGTLAADIVVHPQAVRDPRVAEALERAIARLRYGVVAVNAWSGIVFTLAVGPWGPYPGATPADIQSGTGFVHNTSMLEGVEKVVSRHPLITKPKPIAFPSHRTAHTLARRMTRLEERSSWTKVPGVIAAAMRG